MFKLTPVTSKIGQGHPSSNLTKTLLRYIHGISFGSIRLIFVELSCLQAKCWRTDRRTDGQTDRRTDGQTNLIVGLVTRNPPKNSSKFIMVSKFNIYNVHLKCFDSVRYHLNQYKTLTKNFNRPRTYVHTYIHTDTVKAICPHGDYCPRGHNKICKLLWERWSVYGPGHGVTTTKP